MPSPPPPAKTSLKAEFEHRFNARIKGTDAGMSSGKYSIEGKYSYFTLSYDYQRYSWDKADDSGLGVQGKTPWTGLHNISVRARKNFFLSRKWILNLGGGTGSSFEKEMSDSFWGRADFSFIRIFDGGWSAGIGLAGLYHPVRSAALPLVMISYSPEGKQGFSARFGFPETAVTYSFYENLAAKAYLGYTARIYRLKNNSSVQEKGYFSDQAFKLGMEMTAEPVQNLTVGFGPYYLMDRKIKTFNNNQKRKYNEKIRNTCGIKMNISWNF